jgi:hypothetical protein
MIEKMRRLFARFPSAAVLIFDGHLCGGDSEVSVEVCNPDQSPW